MAKVTSKHQVTVPKTIADLYRIRPGDNIVGEAAGDVIRVIPSDKKAASDDRTLRLRLFDQATARHRNRPTATKGKSRTERGWTREELYERGRAR